MCVEKIYNIFKEHYLLSALVRVRFTVSIVEGLGTLTAHTIAGVLVVAPNSSSVLAVYPVRSDPVVRSVVSVLYITLMSMSVLHSGKLMCFNSMVSSNVHCEPPEIVHTCMRMVQLVHVSGISMNL